MGNYLREDGSLVSIVVNFGEILSEKDNADNDNRMKFLFFLPLLWYLASKSIFSNLTAKQRSASNKFRAKKHLIFLQKVPH